jgi:serine/threonine protein kinase/Flp pilus assembly protein TadD
MIGKTLRQYTITARIGQGGMGEVWLARDGTLGRDVALKILPAGANDAFERKERFFREARSASALNHPNIITIYEINSDEGIDFIAMEYVQGRTLGDLLHHGPMPIDRIERCAEQIAEAVGCAHRAGIVHRDLKPGNIMITDDGLVKVLDFGLAKVSSPSDSSVATAAEPATQMALTRAGTTVGTLGYMSPEQAIGDPVDARSDVFSFGVILYEMLTGRLPFAGKTLSDVLHALHFVEPPPIESLRTGIPPVLHQVALRSLRKAPADRYLNMGDVAIVIKGGIPANAATAAMPLQAVRRSPPMRRVALAGLIVAAIAGVAAVAAWQSRERTAPAATAHEGPVAAEPTSAYELTSAAAILLARPDRDGNPDRAIALLDRALAADPKSALAHAQLSSAYLRKQQTNPDPQWLKLARENAQRSIDLNADLAAGHTAKGFVHVEAGERADAATELRRAAQLDPVNAFPHIGLGLNFAALNQDAEATASFERAIALGPGEWRAYGEFAQFYFRRARYIDAVRHWEAAQKLTPDNVLILRNLGAAYYLLDRHDEAASILQRALEVRPSASTYTNLGTIRFFQGRYTDAVTAFEKAVEMGANNHQFWGNLGDGYRWAPGRRGDALAAYRRASDLIQEQLAKKPGDADLATRHALYLMKMGNRPAALKAIEGVDRRPDLTAQMLYRITVVSELAGDRAGALAALGRALKAGYAVKDLANEPELTALRADARYHRLLDASRTSSPATR